MSDEYSLILKYENGIPEFTCSREDVINNSDVIANLNKAINMFTQNIGIEDDLSQAST